MKAQLTKSEAGLVTTQKVARKLSNSPSLSKSRRLPSAENSSLPQVSELSDKATINRARLLLNTAHKQKKIAAEADEAARTCRLELAAIVLANELTGLRAGNFGISVSGYKRRKSFNVEKAKALMLDAGIDPETIGELYEEGEEYLDTRLMEFA